MTYDRVPGFVENPLKVSAVPPTADTATAPAGLVSSYVVKLSLVGAVFRLGAGLTAASAASALTRSCV